MCCVAAALVLSGCAAPSSYSGLVASSRADYEHAVLSREAAASPRAKATRQARRATPRVAAASEQPQAAGSSEPISPTAVSTTGMMAPPGLNPAGSPAWEREHLEWERRDQELRRKLQGVCRGC
jgi:hypothetical protein